MMSRHSAIVIALAGFILDRIIKYIVVISPRFLDGVFLIDGTLGIKLHINEFFAWSLPVSNKISIGLMVLVGSIVAYTMYKKRDQTELFPLVLVFLGAVSNLADRILYGGVIDYAVLPLGGIINVADIMVIAGVLLFSLLPRSKYAH